MKQAFKTLVAALRLGSKLRNVRAECRHDIEKFVRVWMVDEIRTYQRFNKMLIPARTPKVSDPVLASQLNAYHSELGSTLRKAVRMAAMRLEGTRWAESPAAIEKSYRAVMNDRRLRQQFWIPKRFQFVTTIPGVWDAQTEKEFGTLNPQI